MSASGRSEPRTRRERLRSIAEEYTEEIHDHRTRRQMAGVEPVSHFAAVTSEGSPDSGFASNGNLIVADTTVALAEQLRQECGEGWLAHGRVWDLDAPWHLWGNLEITYSVRVGEDARRPVYLVSVEGRPGGVYVFDDLIDAEAFRRMVRHRGRTAALSVGLILDHRAADQLIDAEGRS
jgi:hypothetical protein